MHFCDTRVKDVVLAESIQDHNAFSTFPTFCYISACCVGILRC